MDNMCEYMFINHAEVEWTQKKNNLLTILCIALLCDVKFEGDVFKSQGAFSVIWAEGKIFIKYPSALLDDLNWLMKSL